MATCPGCGAEVGTENTACPECGASLAEPTASFDPVAIEDAKSAGVASEGPVLVVRKGPQQGERFYIDRRRLSVGRDPKSDIFLNDTTVSRSHAVIDCEDDVVKVTDFGSLNGTYVNGEIVDSATLMNGDVLQIGTFQMLFISGPGAA